MLLPKQGSIGWSRFSPLAFGNKVTKKQNCSLPQHFPFKFSPVSISLSPALNKNKQPRQDKNLLYRHEKPIKPTKEKPLSFVLFEFPFASVSTVNRDHPSLVYLGRKNPIKKDTCTYSSNGQSFGSQRKYSDVKE